MDKFEQAKIYKIRDINSNMCYIGSTCQKYLCKRLGHHKSCFRKYKDENDKSKIMTSFIIFEKYGLNNCIIELVENYPCSDKQELLKREGYYIENTECVNRCVSGRTKQEYQALYYTSHKEEKEHYRKFKAKIYTITPEKRKQYNKTSYEKHKETISQKGTEKYEVEKNKILGRKKEYYDNHKKDIKQFRQSDYTCLICNCVIQYSNKWTHNKTQKHLDNLHNNIENSQ